MWKCSTQYEWHLARQHSVLGVIILSVTFHYCYTERINLCHYIECCMFITIINVIYWVALCWVSFVLSHIFIVMVSVILLNVMASHKWCWQRILSVLVIEQLLTNILFLSPLSKKWSEAVFLVMSDPSMNELWATKTHRDLCIDLSKSLTADS